MGHPFFWYELLTSDVDAAAAFYAEAIGWQVQDFPGTAGYRVVAVGDRGVGGIMATPEDVQGFPPAWLGYVHADDVDAAVDRLVAAGGRLDKGPQDIPGDVGRFAVVRDPQGAMFHLMTPNGPDTPPLSVSTPGAVGWRELHAADGAAAFAFYADQFGWTDDGVADVGMPYQLFAVDGQQHGGMMTRMNPSQPPGWVYYFTVDAIDAALARIEAAGGKLVHGPHQVPGAWVAYCVDPQGASFAITAAVR